jgi:hypothetical protein
MPGSAGGAPSDRSYSGAGGGGNAGPTGGVGGGGPYGATSALSSDSRDSATRHSAAAAEEDLMRSGYYMPEYKH